MSDKAEGHNQEQGDKDENGRVSARPTDAKAFAGPEQTEGRKHHANREFERVFGDPREGPMDHRANGRNRDTGRQRACEREILSVSSFVGRATATNPRR